MKIGVCSPIANIDKVAAIGFDYIEASVTSIVDISEDELLKMVEKVESSKIKCEVFNVLFKKDIKITGMDVDLKPVANYISTALRRVHMLGGKIVVFGSGAVRRIPPEGDYDSTRKQVAKVMEMLGDEAAKYNITIVLEPLNKKETDFVNTVAEGLGLVKELDHPNVLLLADFYHMRMENESMEIIESASRYLKHLHIANSTGRVYPLVNEEDDYRGFADVLKKIGYDGRLSIEGSTKQFDIDAPVSLKLLRELFQD